MIIQTVKGDPGGCKDSLEEVEEETYNQSVCVKKVEVGAMGTDAAVRDKTVSVADDVGDIDKHVESCQSVGEIACAPVNEEGWRVNLDRGLTLAEVR